MNRLNQLNDQAKPTAAQKKRQPTLDVWESLGCDKHLRASVVEKRLKVKKVMEEVYDDFAHYINKQETPKHLIPKIQQTGINGFQIKDFGGPGFTNLEAGAIYHELARKDASIATFVLVHNAIGTNVISCLGDQDQRKRFLSKSINMDEIACFCLTEPLNGSDASGLQTVARKVPGGYLLNGSKRWIGNATFADQLCVWARNLDDGNNIQCFIVTKGSKGLQTSKIMNK